MQVFTGKGIEMYRLTSMKYQVKLEGKGIRFKGYTTRTAQIKRALGLHIRTPRAQVLEEIERRLQGLGRERRR